MEIVGKMRDYVIGVCTLGEFRNVFEPIVCRFIESRNMSDDASLAYAIDLRIAEYMSGHFSEDDFKAKLRLLLEHIDEKESTKFHRD